MRLIRLDAGERLIGVEPVTPENGENGENGEHGEGDVPALPGDGGSLSDEQPVLN